MPIPLLPFGRTGHQSTRIIFGAAALGPRLPGRRRSRARRAARARHQPHRRGRQLRRRRAARRAVAQALSRPVLPGHQDRQAPRRRGARRAAALARPLAGGPRRPVAAAQPVRPDRVGHRAQPGGAIDAAVEAREQGLVRVIGVTGHGAQIAATHRRSLQRFDFDSVLLPYNFTTAAVERTTPRISTRCRPPARSATRPCRPSSRSPTGRGCGRERTQHDLVPAARGPGRHRRGRPLGARPSRASSSSPPAT